MKNKIRRNDRESTFRESTTADATEGAPPTDAMGGRRDHEHVSMR